MNGLAEPLLRLGFFLAGLMLMALWERKMPYRPTQDRSGRWLTNLGLSMLNTLLLRLSVGAALISAASMALSQGWGMLTLLNLPVPIQLIAGVLLLDAALYLQHRLFHTWTPLWRLHKAHHSDLAVDVTTAVRVHPLEMALSMAYKLVIVMVFGLHPLAVLVYEILLNFAPLFHHGNVRLPESADRILRCLVVTPNMHRIHHSSVRRQADSNFGVLLPLWDRLGGSYSSDDEPEEIGLGDLRQRNQVGFWQVLKMPFS